MAVIYLLILSLPFILYMLTKNAIGRVLLLVLWPLASIFYSITYRYIAKDYKCPMTKHLAFSNNGGGSLHGNLYNFSIIIIFSLVTILIRGALRL